MLNILGAHFKRRWRGVVVVPLTLINLLLFNNQLHASESDDLQKAIYLHNKAVLDSNRDKYGARYQPEDYEIDKNSYRFTLVDLNEDNIAEVIVLFNSAEDCGTGGCNMEIYRGPRKVSSICQAVQLPCLQ